MSGSIYVGTKAGTLQAPPAFDEYSGVILTVSDEVEYTAGKTTGRVLEVSCPWGTQKVANRIFSRIRGYQYQPFAAAGVDLNPAAQLGDGVTIENTYGGLYSIETQYGAVSLSDIASPGEEELDHEFTYEPRSQREVRRRFKDVESRLSIQADEISAKVSRTGGNDDKSFEWKLTDDAWELFSNGSSIMRVSKDGLWVEGDGKFTGEVHAGNIKSGKHNGVNYGTFDGSGITKGTITRTKVDSDVEDSLNRADYADGVFTGANKVRKISADQLSSDEILLDGKMLGMSTITYVGVDGQPHVINVVTWRNR